MAVTVSTPVFDGPVDGLLERVTDHKIDILDVPLAVLIEDVLGWLRSVVEDRASGGFDLDAVSEFLLIGAILVELKSKALLPGPDEVDLDEELAGLEQRDLLLARLLELQVYSAAADMLAVLIESAARCVPRSAGLSEEFSGLAPDILAGVTPQMVADAFHRTTLPRPEAVVDLSHVTVEPVTVSEAVAELETRLPGSGPVTFRELTAECTTRMQVIVRFLALLELCKRGAVSLDQGETFGDLFVAWIGPEPTVSAGDPVATGDHVADGGDDAQGRAGAPVDEYAG